MLVASVFISLGFCIVMAAVIWGVAKSSNDKRTIKHLPFSLIPILRYPLVALLLFIGTCLVMIGFALIDN